MWQVRVHNTNTAFKIPLPVSYEVKFSSSSLSTLRYVPREMTVCVHKAMYTTLCNSIVRVSNWNKFKCLLTGKWINKCGVSTGQAIRLSKEKKMIDPALWKNLKTSWGKEAKQNEYFMIAYELKSENRRSYSLIMFQISQE